MSPDEAFNVATEALVSRACGKPCFVVRKDDWMYLKIQLDDVVFLTMELPMDTIVQFPSKTELVQFLSHQAVDAVRKADVERNWAKLEESKAKAAKEKKKL